MKYKYFIISLLGIGCITMASCKKYLKEELVSGVSYGFYDTEVGIESALNATYSELRTPYGSEHGFTFAEYGTDTYTEGSDGSNKSSFNEYGSTLSATHSYVDYMWTSYYRGISVANICINRIPAIKGTQIYISDAVRNERVGESKFLRACFYFMLVQTFGKIPLQTKENLSIQTEFLRAPVSYVYFQIISDLRYAVDNLPVNQGDYGRATKGAALHLLAKVYLTRGSAVTDQRGQQPTDMDSAAYYAEQLINNYSNKYKLLPDFAQIYKAGNERNSEVVFGIEFTKNPLYNGSGNMTDHWYLMEYDVLPGMQRSVDNGKPWKRLRPTDYILDVYDRKNESRFY
jgi:hypothetical protein